MKRISIFLAILSFTASAHFKAAVHAEELPNPFDPFTYMDQTLHQELTDMTTDEISSNSIQKNEVFLFIPGINALAGNMKRARAYCRSKGFRTAVFVQRSEAPDFKGSAKSLRMDLQNAIERLIHRHKFKKVHLVAHSGGTISALYLYQKWTEMWKYVASIKFYSPIILETQILSIDDLHKIANLYLARELPLFHISSSDDIDLTIEIKRILGTANHPRRVLRLKKSLDFVISGIEALREIHRAGFPRASLIPLYFLYSSADFHMDVVALEILAEQLRANGKDVTLVDLENRPGDPHETLHLHQGRDGHMNSDPAATYLTEAREFSPEKVQTIDLLNACADVIESMDRLRNSYPGDTLPLAPPPDQGFDFIQRRSP